MQSCRGKWLHAEWVASAAFFDAFFHAGDQDAVQTVRRVRASVSQLQQSNMQQLQQLHNEAAAYVQELEAIHEVLQQLVGQCMVAEQPKIAQVRSTYSESQAQRGGLVLAAGVLGRKLRLGGWSLHVAWRVISMGRLQQPDNLQLC